MSIKRATIMAQQSWPLMITSMDIWRFMSLTSDLYMHPYDDVDNVFIKEDRCQFPKGTIGRRIKEFFKWAGICHDINISATRIRQIHSTGASEMSPKKRKTIASHSHMKHKISTADCNRPFYSCRLSDLVSEWQRGWRWPCFGTDLTAFIVQINLILC